MLSPKANAARILLIAKVNEAKKIQAKFLRIKTRLAELREQQSSCPVTDEHCEILLKMFIMGALSHNLATMIWLYNFTSELKEELHNQLVREHRIHHQIERLFNFGDRLDAKFQPLLEEIGQLDKTVQRG